MAKRDRRAEIMRAAEKLFTSRRYHQISLDDVAHDAKVGKGTIYRYFKNKEDLFLQTASSGFEELCDLIGRGVRRDGSFREELLGACRQISDFFVRRRQLFRMMQSEHLRMFWRRGEVRKRWRERRKKLVAAVAVIVGKGVGEGVLRTDVPAEVLAGYLLGMLRTRAWAAADVGEEWQSLELVVDLFCNGAGEREAAVVEAAAAGGDKGTTGRGT